MPKKIVPQQETHNGYNEENPTQPQGAFATDNTTSGKGPIREKSTRGKKLSGKKSYNDQG